MAATLDDLLTVAKEIQSDLRADSQRSSSGSSGGTAERISGAFGSVAVAAARAQAALTAFTGTFDRVISSLGGAMAKFVQLANPATVFRFNLAVENAMSALGRVFAPILDRFTLIIQRLGNAIESLSPQAKQLVGALAAGGGLAGVFGAIATAVGLLLQTVGRVPLIIGAIVSAVAGVMLATSSGQSILASLGKVTKAFGSLVEVIARMLMPVIEAALVPMLETAAQAIVDLTTSLHGLVNAAREMAGFAAIDYDPNAKTALATKPAQMGDLRGLSGRAYVSAWNSQGQGADDLAKKHLEESRKQTGILQDLLSATRLAGPGGGQLRRAGQRVGGNTGGAIGGVAEFGLGPVARLLTRMAGRL